MISAEIEAIENQSAICDPGKYDRMMARMRVKTKADALLIVLDFARTHGGGLPCVVEALKVLTTGRAPAKGASMGAAAEPSERGLAFADWFRTTLPATFREGDAWREKWARCFDDLVRLDGRTEADIARVCKWARADGFWCQNFLTPLKLRERKDGAQYFDRFLEAMAKGGNGAAARKSRAIAGEHRLRDGYGPAVYDPTKD
jgi:hypothetical protein